MSAPPQLRRTDKVMAEDRSLELLAHGFCGRLATVGEDGSPYCVPLLYVWMDGEVYVHNAAGSGHLGDNVRHEARVCFEVDEPGEVFDYGRFECDSSVEYRSVILFGTIRPVEAEAAKQRFCDALMAKYRLQGSERPRGFYPRLDKIAVYAISVDRMSGKQQPLPDLRERWPSQDRTKTPDASPPDGARS